jgi:hypothetical protein
MPRTSRLIARLPRPSRLTKQVRLNARPIPLFVSSLTAFVKIASLIDVATLARTFRRERAAENAADYLKFNEVID